jgi:hypothetical protein
MTKVHALRGAAVPTNEPNEALVAALKDILAEAESGLLQSFIAAGFRSDGLRMSCFLGAHSNVYEVIGSIEMLKQDYIDRHTEKL